MLECRILFHVGQSNGSIAQDLNQLQRVGTDGHTSQIELLNDVHSKLLIECIVHSETFYDLSKCTYLIIFQDVTQYKDPK